MCLYHQISGYVINLSRNIDDQGLRAVFIQIIIQYPMKIFHAVELFACPDADGGATVFNEILIPGKRPFQARRRNLQSIRAGKYVINIKDVTCLLADFRTVSDGDPSL